MKILKKPLSILLSFFLLTFAFSPLTASAETFKNKEINYVSLGDSLAAGVTPYGGWGPGYPHYLTEMLKTKNNVNPSYFGVPGYTTNDILLDLTDASRSHHKPLKKALRKADIVTLDIGAIDILSKMLAGQQVTQKDIKNTVNNIATILVIIKKMNPKAKVYVMGYYNPFPHPNSAYAPYVPTILYALNNFNNSVEAVSGFLGAEFVPTATLVQANYSTYLPHPNNIHLSAEGYQGVANEFWTAINGKRLALN